MIEMKNDLLVGNIAIAIMAIAGMLVVFIEKDSLLYLSEDQFTHFIPMIVLSWYMLTAIIFSILSFVVLMQKIKPTKSFGINEIICTFSITFLIGNTMILFMHATHQYPSGLWSQLEFGLSAVTPLGVLTECIFLFVIWKMYWNCRAEAST